uniref:Uncharacterized protein n=1 Tax=Timema cristinae TaxID=61476 RepID=A0A7R9CR66_TIMCR|nr:unnamed protein product [Timema cristinae]
MSTTSLDLSKTFKSSVFTIFCTTSVELSKLIIASTSASVRDDDFTSPMKAVLTAELKVATFAQEYHFTFLHPCPGDFSVGHYFYQHPDSLIYKMVLKYLKYHFLKIKYQHGNTSELTLGHPSALITFLSARFNRKITVKASILFCVSEINFDSIMKI